MASWPYAFCMKPMDLTTDPDPAEFSRWTLEQIRAKGSAFSWMEERRFDWVPIAASAIEHLIGAHTMILVTDGEREWFAHYALTRLNRINTDRPLLPILSLEMIFPQIDRLLESGQRDIMENMLSETFPNDFIFFYVGRGNDTRAQIAKSKGDSLLWLFDEQMQNSFTLRSDDDERDIKLIQMLTLFDKSIDAILFGEADIQNLL